MSVALQIALFLASLAIIALAACVIGFAVVARRQLAQLVSSAEQMKADVQALLQDSRELVRNVNDMAKRASEQMDDVSEIVQTVQQWTARADRIVEGVGSVIEPPIFSLVRHASLLRTGVGAFVGALFHSNQHNEAEVDHG